MYARLPLPVCVLLAYACNTSDVDPTTDVVDSDPDDSIPVVNTDEPVDTEPPAPKLTIFSTGPKPCQAPVPAGGPFFEVRRADAYRAEVPFVVGGGVAVAELDGDGIPDTVVVNQRAVHVLHPLVQAGTRGEVILSHDDPDPRHGFFGASAADYDGDGDFDLMITRHPGPNTLLQNDGRGVFSDVTAQAGVAGPDDHWSASSAWADMDLDGDLDLVVAGYGAFPEDPEIPAEAFEPADPTLLYENLGDGTFADVTDRIEASTQGSFTFTAGFHDIDGDLLPDLYLANDFAEKRDPSRALLQRGGRFVLDTSVDGLTSTVIGMGLGAGDLNGDQRLDFLLPGWNDLGLLVSQPGGWFDMSQVLGVEPDSRRDQKVAWASEFVDINNDARLDIFVGYGYLDSRSTVNELRQPDSMFLQTGDMVFEDRGERLGLDQSVSTRGVVFADVNEDGWLDFTRVSLDADAGLFVAACGERSWIRVNLRQDGMNRHAIGARVKVRTGAIEQTRYILAGGTGWGSSGPPDAHFGLDMSEVVDEIEITWPDGHIDQIEQVNAREVLTLTRAPTTSP
jgi:hypothetical protein